MVGDFVTTARSVYPHTKTNLFTFFASVFASSRLRGNSPVNETRLLNQRLHALFPARRPARNQGRRASTGVEILADVPHAYPPQITPELTVRCRQALDELGLAVSNINCNCSFGYWKDAPPEPYFEPSLISPNPKHRADRTEMIVKTLEFARDVGAANISITSGRMLGGMPPDKAAGQFAESIRPILDRADALGINVGIECEPGLFLEYIAGAARVDRPPRAIRASAPISTSVTAR